MTDTTHYCEFCKTSIATLQCDGLLDPPTPAELQTVMGGLRAAKRTIKTCDRWMCRSCAGLPALQFHVRRSKPARSGTETLDLCPDCQQAGRKATLA